MRENGDFQTYNKTFNFLSKASEVTFADRGQLIERLLSYYKSSVNVMKQLREIITDIRDEIQV